MLPGSYLEDTALNVLGASLGTDELLVAPLSSWYQQELSLLTAAVPTNRHCLVKSIIGFSLSYNNNNNDNTINKITFHFTITLKFWECKHYISTLTPLLKEDSQRLIYSKIFFCFLTNIFVRCDYDGRPLRTETGTDRSRSQRLGRGSGHIGAFRAESGNMSPSHTKYTRESK